MTAHEMKLFVSGDWVVASDEPAGTVVPSESERWIATDSPTEVQR